ncbi:flippase-like domain-containing protein, partial [Candidatus Micrarchaeota archaeon]|nr:flippase-like domain-containing protein [Candidatus Micrarchaeota archaeon]
AYIVLGLISVFLMDIFLAYRITMILEETGTKIRLIDALKAHFVGMLAADFTPSRSGYFATAAVLRYNYKVESDKALLAIFGPQMFDFVAKLVSGTIAILYIMYVFIGPEKGWILILSAVLISVIVAMMLLVLFSKKFLKIFAFVQKIPVLGKLYPTIVKMQESSHIIVKKTPHLIGLIAITWFLRSLSWYFVAKSVGITVNTPFPEIVFYIFLQPLITMLEFMPSFTLAGLGLSEGGSTLVFSLFGIEAAKALVFGLIVRFKTTALHLPAVPEALHIMNNMDKENGAHVQSFKLSRNRNQVKK